MKRMKNGMDLLQDMAKLVTRVLDSDTPPTPRDEKKKVRLLRRLCKAKDISEDAREGFRELLAEMGG